MGDKIIFNDPVKQINVYVSKFYDNFSNIINAMILDNLPKKLTQLTFDDCFNDKIHKRIPSTVKYLKFGSEFNQPLDPNDIPLGVTHLEFGKKINQSIKDVIPNTVIHLEFGYKFNRKIVGRLPNNLIHLSFGINFNKPIVDAIPNSVKNYNFVGILTNP